MFVADDAGIRSEMLLPQAMAEHHDIGVAGLIFLGKKHTAQRRLHSQSREKAGCRRTRIDLLRLVAAGQGEPAEWL